MIVGKCQRSFFGNLFIFPVLIYDKNISFVVWCDVIAYHLLLFITIIIIMNINSLNIFYFRIKIEFMLLGKKKSYYLADKGLTTINHKHNRVLFRL